jgi:hypothetical protein
VPNRRRLGTLAIDLSVTGLTVALLALTSAERSEVQAAEPAAVGTQPVAPVHVSVHAVAQASSVPDLDPAPTVVEAAMIDVGDARWVADTTAAEAMLAQGVTCIDRVKIAKVFAEHADGVTTSMIARKLSIGYGTVVHH